jgi:predicted homoserine dehydrogenase-like protein
MRASPIVVTSASLSLTPARASCEKKDEASGAGAAAAEREDAVARAKGTMAPREDHDADGGLEVTARAAARTRRRVEGMTRRAGRPLGRANDDER